MPQNPLPRKEWNSRYAARLNSVSGMTLELAADSAESADDFYNDGMNPEESADEEMSCWTDDGED